jgi:hypothetical protein
MCLDHGYSGFSIMFFVRMYFFLDFIVCFALFVSYKAGGICECAQ